MDRPQENAYVEAHGSGPTAILSLSSLARKYPSLICSIPCTTPLFHTPRNNLHPTTHASHCAQRPTRPTAPEAAALPLHHTHHAVHNYLAGPPHPTEQPSCSTPRITLRKTTCSAHPTRSSSLPATPYTLTPSPSLGSCLRSTPHTTAGPREHRGPAVCWPAPNTNQILLLRFHLPHRTLPDHRSLLPRQR